MYSTRSSYRKICASGFNQETVTLIYSYLTRREHKVKVNNFPIEFLTLHLGLPQEFLLCFNIIQYTLKSSTLTFLNAEAIYTLHFTNNNFEYVKVTNCVHLLLSHVYFTVVHFRRRFHYAVHVGYQIIGLGQIPTQ